MSNKILLAVNQYFLSEYRDYISIENTLNSSHDRRVNAYDAEIAQAKADAEAYIAEIKKEVAEEIFEELDNVWFVDVLDEPDYEQLKAKYKVGE